MSSDSRDGPAKLRDWTGRERIRLTLSDLTRFVIILPDPGGALKFAALSYTIVITALFVARYHSILPRTRAWIGELGNRLEAQDWTLHPLVEPVAALVTRPDLRDALATRTLIMPRAVAGATLAASPDPK